MTRNFQKKGGRGRTPVAQKRAGGRKPDVAFQSAKAALGNIRCKLNILQACLAGNGPLVDANGKIIHEFIPESKRQFNNWRSDDLKNSIQAGLPSFTKNANSTLNKHASERASIETALERIKVIRETADSGGNTKEDKLSRLRDESRLQKTIREIAERELAKTLRELTKLRTEIVSLKIQLKSQAKEARQQSELASSELDELRSRNASLAATLRKVTPLKENDASKV